MVLGVFAGAGAGKSLLLSVLREDYGFVCIQADKLAHDLYEKGAPVWEALRRHFGEGIIGSQGEILREVLAERVFGNKEDMDFVNALVHPAVWQKTEEAIASAKREGRNIVVEAALLPPFSARELYEHRIFIDTEEKERRKRLKARSYEKKRIDALFALQPSEEAYRSFCDYCLVNRGSVESFKQEIKKMMEKFNSENV